MKQEDKELLFKDLCSRLPYGVKLKCASYKIICIGPYTLDTIILDRIFNENTEYVPFDEFKPYLFPLSSMTEEQKDIFSKLWWNTNGLNMAMHAIDYLNKNHFDYRGLIEKGLAIDATGLNIY